MEIKDRVLVVEDDKRISNFIKTVLEANNYDVIVAQTGAEAYSMVTSQCPDVVILDLGLPDMDGMKILQGVREWSAMPVIVVSARTHERDKVEALDLGADDYITKPFSISALQRKIKAMFAMLEHHKPAKDIYEDGSLFLDFSEQFASLNGKPLALSAMEYKMLNLFLKNPKQVLTRQQLLERLWVIDEKYVDEHTLTTSISRIRSKIEADGDTYIKTVYGMGYQWTGGEKK